MADRPVAVLAVSLNPAIDVTYRVEVLRPGETHRVHDIRAMPGGKALNAARVLASLGHPVTVTGFAGGGTGAFLRRGLSETPVVDELLAIGGETRRTVTVVDGGGATGFWEPGPRVTSREWARLRRRVAELAVAHAVVVLSGRLPAGLPVHAYADLTEIAHAAGRPAIVDGEGEALRCALDAFPDVIKPNRDELLHVAATLGVFPRPASGSAASSWAPLLEASACLRSAGAMAVVASSGPAGLLALTEVGAFAGQPPATLVGNPTGAGDAVVAALARGLATGETWQAVLADALALSASAVMASDAGAFSLEHYHRWRDVVRVQELSS
jgi:tagatose 6-phosphate kinase